jgi:O-antigen/teichoic acid export membrane protein
MTRLFALVGVVYQSAAAIILIFLLGRVLSPLAYAKFSLTLASSQLLSVLMFEWLQLAGVRFLAAAMEEDAARLRSSLFAAALASAIVLLVLGGLAAAVVAPISASVGFVGLALAVAQGATDLHFMVVRVSHRLGAAAFLLILRATLMVGGATAGAWIYGTANAALLGMLSAQLASLIAGQLMHPHVLRSVPRPALLKDWSGFARYGMLAAGASVLHLSVPVSIRFVVVSALGDAAPAVTAGFSMAIDLLQRPFAVLVAAIHTVNYPEVVHQFERGSANAARAAVAHLLDFIMCATLVMLGGLIGFLPDAGHLFVPSSILASFLQTSAAAACFYFMHCHLQSTLAIVPHLTKSAMRLVVVALCQLVLVLAVAVPTQAMAAAPTYVLVSAILATGIVIVLASGPMLRFGAAPRWSLVAASVAAAAFIATFSTISSPSVVWLMLKIAIAAAIVALLAWKGRFLEAAGASRSVV